MPTRTFTPAEANSALERVRPLAERMVAVRARLGELESEQRDVVKIIAGNGSGYGSARRARRSSRGSRRELDACLNQLDALGVEVKDRETGLLDFPAMRDGEEVLLCWRVGRGRGRVVARAPRRVSPAGSGSTGTNRAGDVHSGSGSSSPSS